MTKMRQIPLSRLLGSKYRVYSPQYQEESYIFQEKGGEITPDGFTAISLESEFGNTLKNYHEGDSFLFREIPYRVLELQRPSEPAGPDDPEFDLMPGAKQIEVFCELFRKIRPEEISQLIRTLLNNYPCLIGEDLLWTSINDQSIISSILQELIKIKYQGLYPAVEPYAGVLKLFSLPPGTKITPEIVSHWSAIPELIRYAMLVFSIRSRFCWPDLKSIFHDETVPFLKMLVALVWLCQNGKSSMANFEKFREIFHDYLIQLAWDFKINGPVNFTPLLPNCVMGKNLIHCEAGGSDDTEPQKAWCQSSYCEYGCLNPRQLLKVDGEGNPFNSGNEQASLFLSFRETELNPDYYWDYNLHEIFRELALTPVHPLINRSGEYVTLIGGWVNRLNEIKPRLNCQKCRQPLSPAPGHSNDFTENLVLIVQCFNQDCVSYEKTISIGHCWGCGHVIDGRENQNPSETEYRCRKCGRGPKGHTLL